MFGEKKKKEEPRFVQCYSGVAKDFGNVKILVDTETGVQYLITWSTYHTWKSASAPAERPSGN